MYRQNKKSTRIASGREDSVYNSKAKKNPLAKIYKKYCKAYMRKTSERKPLEGSQNKLLERHTIFLDRITQHKNVNFAWVNL